MLHVSEGAPSSVSYIGTEAGKLMVVNSIEQVQKVYADGGSGGGAEISRIVAESIIGT